MSGAERVRPRPCPQTMPDLMTMVAEDAAALLKMHRTWDENAAELLRNIRTAMAQEGVVTTRRDDDELIGPVRLHLRLLAERSSSALESAIALQADLVTLHEKAVSARRRRATS